MTVGQLAKKMGVTKSVLYNTMIKEGCFPHRQKVRGGPRLLYR